MKAKFTILIIIFFVIASKSNANSMNDSLIKKYGIGFVGNLGYLMHSTDVPIIWGAGNCGQYSSGNSIGYGVGIELLYKIFPELITLDLRFIYKHVPANFDLTTSDYNVFNPIDKKYEPFVVKHELKSNLDYLSFEPSIIIKPLDDIPIKMRIGADIGNPMFGSDFESTDEIISPKIYTFPDESQKHVTQSGKLNNAGTSISILSGLMYEHELLSDLYINGEITYKYPINSNLSDNKWEVTSIGATLSLNYFFDFTPKPEVKIEKPIIIDTVKPPIIVEKVILDTIKPINFEFSAGPLNLLETVVTQTYPILPYIFFDSVSSEINSKYLQNSSIDFSESAVPMSTLDIYYSMLDIIGFRLKNNPQAEITIKGMTDGRETTDYIERLKIAEKRANAVLEYFKSKWGVDKKRMKLSVQDLPDLATSKIYNEGFEENRRVEILSNSGDILKPVIHSKFNEYEVLNSQLDLLVNSADVKNFENWELKLFTENEPIANLTNKNLSDSLIVINLNDTQKKSIIKAVENKSKIYAKFQFKHNDSIISKTIEIIPTKNANSFELGRLNLIVFDFDKSDINEMNQNMISNFVINSIFENSKVKILGSTDKLGEKEYNLKLSEERANSAYNYLKKMKPNTTFSEVKGIGDSNLLYNNNLPEGRFYCRTVMIEVTTPNK